MKSCSPRRRDKDNRAGLRSGTPLGKGVRTGASFPRQVLVLILCQMRDHQPLPSQVPMGMDPGVYALVEARQGQRVREALATERGAFLPSHRLRALGVKAVWARCWSSLQRRPPLEAARLG